MHGLSCLLFEVAVFPNAGCRLFTAPLHLLFNAADGSVEADRELFIDDASVYHDASEIATHESAPRYVSYIRTPCCESAGTLKFFGHAWLPAVNVGVNKVTATGTTDLVDEPTTHKLEL